MTVILQRLPRKKLGIHRRDFTVSEKNKIRFYPKPAEVLFSFKVIDDELHMRSECQDVKPSEWYLVPPAGRKILGVDLQVWAIDTKLENATVTFSTTEEARKWQIDCLVEV